MTFPECAANPDAMAHEFGVMFSYPLFYVLAFACVGCRTAADESFTNVLQRFRSADRIEVDVESAADPTCNVTCTMVNKDDISQLIGLFPESGSATKHNGFPAIGDRITIKAIHEASGAPDLYLTVGVNRVLFYYYEDRSYIHLMHLPSDDLFRKLKDRAGCKTQSPK